MHAQPPPPPPQPPSKVRLMVSYGGRIQPRPHDNQLAYVNGETKIISLERPLRFADFAARLVALVGGGGDFCVKYQLPGEDLDALVSVTNDEDLEHLVLEYDRLHLLRPAGGGSGSNRGGANLRLRVFLFPVVQSPPPPPQPSGLLDPKPPSATERHWFVDALNTVPQQQQPPPPKQQDSSPPAQQKQQDSSPPPKHESSPQKQQDSSPPPAEQRLELVFAQQQQQMQMTAPPQPQQRAVLLTTVSPDYLFGLDNSFVPPPAVKVKDPAGDPPTARENVPVEIPATRTEDRSPPNPAGDEFHRQIQELEKMQVAAAPADNASHQPPLPRNGSDDSLTRAYPPAAAATPTANAEYYIPKFPEKPHVPPPSSYLPVQGRYASVAPGNGAEQHPGPVFFIPAPPHGYYATAATPGANSYHQAVYAVAPPPSANGNNGNNNGSGAPSNATAYIPPPPQHQVAYDGNGRAIYYTSVLPPQYPSAAVNGMSAAPGAVLGSEPAKQPVAVKPTVS